MKGAATFRKLLRRPEIKQTDGGEELYSPDGRAELAKHVIISNISFPHQRAMRGVAFTYCESIAPRTK